MPASSARPAASRSTASAQMPHMLRTGIADLLGMRESDLRVVAPDVGGAFGQKMSLFPEYVVVVWIARRFRTSVAWIEDRRENLIASAHSRDQRHLVRGASLPTAGCWRSKATSAAMSAPTPATR